MEFKTIERAPRYEINRQGVIRNKETGKIRKHGINAKGYPTVGLSTEPNVQPRFMVHVELANAFIPNPNPDEYNVVMHLDDDVTNFALDNLKWGTQKQNMEQSSATGYYSTVKQECLLESPTGEIIEVKGYRAFCAANNLDWGNMQKVFKGQRKSCKGWRLVK